MNSADIYRIHFYYTGIKDLIRVLPQTKFQNFINKIKILFGEEEEWARSRIVLNCQLWLNHNNIEG